MQHFKAKVCVIGDPEVGKTSLVARYVLGEWDGRRRTTLGAQVSERGQLLDLRRFGLTLSKLAEGARLEWPPEVHLDMIIWDIMGSRTIRDVSRGTYFDGARGFLAVADVSRKETLDQIPVWVRAARRFVGDAPIVLAVNKSDLADKAAFSGEAAQEVASALDAPLVYTSAKTNENVEAAFRNLAGDVVLRLLGF